MGLRRKITATIVLFLLLSLCLSLIIYFTESPILLFRKIKTNKSCAALAIRDDVVPFQKFGTRLFTYPYLQSAYAEVVYLTEYSKNEKHKEFVDGLERLLRNYDQTDIYLLAHANSYYEWVNELDSSLRKKIRLVYNTGCSGAEQQATWLGLGAKCYVGHKSSESISPVFYFYFLRRWCAGEKVGVATTASNQYMLEKIERLGIELDPVILHESEAECFGLTELTIENE